MASRVWPHMREIPYLCSFKKHNRLFIMFVCTHHQKGTKVMFVYLFTISSTGRHLTSKIKPYLAAASLFSFLGFWMQLWGGHLIAFYSWKTSVRNWHIRFIKLIKTTCYYKLLKKVVLLDLISWLQGTKSIFMLPLIASFESYYFL